MLIPKPITTLKAYNREAGSHRTGDSTPWLSPGPSSRRWVDRGCKSGGRPGHSLSSLAQPLLALSQSELLWEIGEESLFKDVDEALAAARAHLGLPANESGR